jgi:hypothetical protein
MKFINILILVKNYFDRFMTVLERSFGFFTEGELKKLSNLEAKKRNKTNA